MSDPFRPDNTGKEPAAKDVGAKLVANNGCGSCHSVDGTTGTGPTWKNMFGHKGTFTDGTPYTANEDYIRDSILYPQKHIVAGFGPAMPSYAGKFSDRELIAIIAYMKSISPDNFKGSPAEFNDPTVKANEDRSKTK
ncbi:MAG: cytochrome c [Tepidisphaeraceae bacterium]